MSIGIFLRRRLRFIDSKFIIILTIVITIFWLTVRYNSKSDSLNSNVHFIKLNDDVNLKNTNGNDNSTIYTYNKNIPLIFVGGVPRSGTTLMRAILDAHPLIRCGEETRVIPRVLNMRGSWLSNQKESERLKNAGITDDVLDSAVRSFMLEVIVKHGKPAPHLCNKDPLVLRYSSYVGRLFPNAKFVLMIRDARATVHSIITRKVTITGFNLNSYPDCFKRWNTIIENMFSQCIALGFGVCLPVYYEQLVLHPEQEIRKILEFLQIEWNDAVLNHEKYIGNEISLSKLERSTDQVVKPINLEALTSWVGVIPNEVLDDIDNLAPMLSKLGYDTKSKTPNYGDADAKIKRNTELVQENKDYWLKLAQKYSVHVAEPQ